MSAETLPIVTIERRFEAPPEAVFDAWLDPTAASNWLFRTKSGVLERCAIDARVGGAFVIVERRGAALADHFGTYLELERPRRLVFTFATDREENPSRVTIVIAPEPGGCRLTLTHEIDSAWAAYADSTMAGWTRILEGLAASLDAAGPEPTR